MARLQDCNYIQLKRKYGRHPEQQNSLLPLSCDLPCNFIPVVREGLAFANLFAAK